MTRPSIRPCRSGQPNKAASRQRHPGSIAAVAKAAADALGIPLYQYIGGTNSKVLPVPMMNIINGGKHADNSVTIQEFMIMPVGAESFKQALQWCAEVFHNLKSVLKSKGYSTAVGDEGGFAPNLKSDEEAIQVIIEAVEKAGFKPGEQFRIAIDAASTEMYEEAKAKGKEGMYYWWKTDKWMTKEEMVGFWEEMCSKYPIISIEDGVSEDDWEAWKLLTDKLGEKVQLVGDDLFVTNTVRLKKGIDMGVANSILIKVNQIEPHRDPGSHRDGQQSRLHAVTSHRSGETEDATIADIAVATNSGQIKTGAPSGPTAWQYNQLLRIEEELAKWPSIRACCMVQPEEQVRASYS